MKYLATLKLATNTGDYKEANSLDDTKGMAIQSKLL